MKEYKVIIYDKITNMEEYEYFTNKKESISYAKDIKDENNSVLVEKITYDYEDDYEDMEYVLELD